MLARCARSPHLAMLLRHGSERQQWSGCSLAALARHTSPCCFAMARSGSNSRDARSLRSLATPRHVASPWLGAAAKVGMLARCARSPHLAMLLRHGSERRQRWGCSLASLARHTSPCCFAMARSGGNGRDARSLRSLATPRHVASPWLGAAGIAADYAAALRRSLRRALRQIMRFLSGRAAGYFIPRPPEVRRCRHCGLDQCRTRLCPMPRSRPSPPLAHLPPRGAPYKVVAPRVI